MNMHMNHGVHFTLPNQKVQLFEQYFEEYMGAWEEFRSVCEQEAEGSDIKICIENTDGYKSYEKSAIAFLLQSDVFGLTWDIGHSNAAGNVDEPFILEHQDKLYHFHIHDSLGKQDHMTLGTGEIDLGQRLDLAEKCQCRCVVETKDGCGAQRFCAVDMGRLYQEILGMAGRDCYDNTGFYENKERGGIRLSKKRRKAW